MKFKILSFLLFTSLTIVQTSEYSIEVAYLLPIDQNFIGDNYQGIADFGL